MTETTKQGENAEKRRPPNAGKGRPPGLPNKLTRTAREAFQHAFEKIGGAEQLATWAVDNPTEFYKLFARLIPVQAEHSGDMGLSINVVRFGDHHDPE